MGYSLAADMKILMKFFLSLVAVIFVCIHVHAAELAGVAFPSTTSLNNVKIKLNGLGVRAATIFKIKAYVAGIYLDKTSSDVDTILNNTGPKIIEMKFLRSVGTSRLADGWIDGFKDNNENYSELEERVVRLAEIMPDVDEGDSFQFEILPGLTKVKFNSKILTEVKGDDFSRGLLRVWLGPEPPDEDLKKGMLGELDG